MVETRSKKKQRMVANTPTLPPSVWVQVGDFLPRRDFNSLTYTCKAIHKFSQLPSVVPKWPDGIVIRPCPSIKTHPTDAVFSPDGKFFAINDVDNDEMRLWDVRRGEVPGFATIQYDANDFKFSPDGNFLAVTYSYHEMLTFRTLRVYIKKECCEGKMKGLDSFDPRHYLDVPLPEGFLDIDSIVWAPDSKSFMGAGSCNKNSFAKRMPMRGTWDLVDGHFAQSGPLTVFGFWRPLAKVSNFSSRRDNLYCLLSFVRSPYFVATFGSHILTSAEEDEMLEKISNLCIGDDNNQKIVIFNSQSKPSVLFVQTSEAKLYALEVYRENDSFLPSFRKLAESQTFPVKSGDWRRPGMEVPGSEVISVMNFWEDRKNRIHLFELQEKTITGEGVPPDCNAARLVAMANRHVAKTIGGVKDFWFSPSGKTLVVVYDELPRGLDVLKGVDRSRDFCRMFSV